MSGVVKKRPKKRKYNELENDISTNAYPKPKRPRIHTYSYSSITGPTSAKSMATKYLNISQKKIMVSERIDGNVYEAWFTLGACGQNQKYQFAIFYNNIFKKCICWDGIGSAAINITDSANENTILNDIKKKCQQITFSCILSKEKTRSTFGNMRYMFQTQLIKLMTHDKSWRDSQVLQVMAKYILKLYKNGKILSTVQKCNSCGKNNKYVIDKKVCLNTKCGSYTKINDNGSVNIVGYEYCSTKLSDNSNKRIFYAMIDATNAYTEFNSYNIKYVAVRDDNSVNSNAAFFNIYKQHFFKQYGIQFTRIDIEKISPPNPQHIGLTNIDYLMQYVDDGNTDKKEEYKLGKGKYGDVILVKYGDNYFADKRLKFGVDNLNEITMLEWISNFEEYDKYMVKIHNMYVYNEYVHIILSRCDYDLSVMINEGKGLLSHHNICTVLYSVGSAIKFFHENLRLIHGDIKPKNILIENGVPKLADVGTVSHIDIIQSKTCGTYEYLAPELCAENAQYSFHVDIFGFGICLVEMIKGGSWLKLINIHGANLPIEKKRKVYYGQVTLAYQQFVSKPMHEFKSKPYYSPETLCGDRYSMYVDIIYGMLEYSPQKRMKLSHVLNNTFVMENKLDKIQLKNSNNTTDFELLSVDLGGIEGTVST